jgi:hypothetical protein
MLSFGAMAARRLKTEDELLPGLIDAAIEEDDRTNL